MKNNYIIGYTTGVFDLFHIGHLNILRNSKALCDRLIVGVTTDELVSYKGKTSIISFEERLQIVSSIKYVDLAIAQTSMDKYEAWKKLKFDIMFVGDDWYNSPKWREFEDQFRRVAVKIVYLPYTKGTNSTLLQKTIKKISDQP